MSLGLLQRVQHPDPLATATMAPRNEGEVLMDYDTLDAFARALAAGSSRRGVLARLGSALLAALSFASSGDTAANKHRKRKRKRRQRRNRESLLPPLPPPPPLPPHPNPHRIV